MGITANGRHLPSVAPFPILGPRSALMRAARSERDTLIAGIAIAIHLILSLALIALILLPRVGVVACPTPLAAEWDRWEASRGRPSRAQPRPFHRGGGAAVCVHDTRARVGVGVTLLGSGLADPRATYKEEYA